MHRPVIRSVARRTVPLAAAHLADLPEQVQDRLTWACLPARGDREDAAWHARAAWIEEVQRTWGTCGQVICQGDRVVALAVYAPPAWLPGARRCPTAPASADAVVLVGMHVEASHRGGGLARVLVQACARDLMRRGAAYAAIEVFAGAGRSLMPVSFWTRLGFCVELDHPITPRMRLDLRRTVRSRAERAWGALAGGVVGPRPVAAPPPLGRGRG